MTEPEPHACTCWIEVALHEPHCCFAELPDDYPQDQPLPCGHDETGMAMLREAQRHE